VTLQDLRARHEALMVELLTTIEREFPGRDEWDWYRALHAVRNEPGRRNEDQSDDIGLAGSVMIRAAWDAYIKALHEFYRARDGEHGVLGGRGI